LIPQFTTTTLAIIIFYLFLQRVFIESITSTDIKG